MTDLWGEKRQERVLFATGPSESVHLDRTEQQSLYHFFLSRNLSCLVEAIFNFDPVPVPVMG